VREPAGPLKGEGSRPRRAGPGENSPAVPEFRWTPGKTEEKGGKKGGGGGGADARGPRSERERKGRETQRAARAGEKGDGPAWPTRERGERARGGEGEGSGELGWAQGVGCSLLFPFLSFFFTLIIQTKPFEFK
jgi:hypothetical protein